MHGRFRSVLILVACIGTLSVVAESAKAQQVNIEEVDIPFAIPFYAGDLWNDDTGVGDFITLSGLSMYFIRPMDSLSPRPGAEAMAMGGANLADVAGPDAMGWNPAGLAHLKAPAFSMDGFHLSSGGTCADMPETVLVPGMPELNVSRYENYLSSRNAFGFIGGAAPLFNIGSRPLVGGICLRRHTEVAYGEEVLMNLTLLEGTGMDLVYGHENEERGAVYSNTVSLAYQVLSQEDWTVSAGFSANFLDGRLRSNQEIQVNVRGGLPAVTTFQRDYKGFSMELGLQAEVRDLVKLGGWMSLPYDLDSENSKFYYLPVAAPQQTEIVAFRGQIADFTMEMPMFMGAGIAVGPIKGIEVAADINYHPWSEVKIKHTTKGTLPYGTGSGIAFYEYSKFDTDLWAADVTSYHVGGKFEFPLYRKPMNRWGLKLNTLIGYRNLPLSMQGIDLVEGDAPYYSGSQVEGSAMTFGLSLETDTKYSFSLGIEKQSYEFRHWFLYDTTDLALRAVSFRDPWDRAPVTKRSVTVFRFTAEMEL